MTLLTFHDQQDRPIHIVASAITIIGPAYDKSKGNEPVGGAIILTIGGHQVHVKESVEQVNQILADNP